MDILHQVRIHIAIIVSQWAMQFVKMWLIRAIDVEVQAARVFFVDVKLAWDRIDELLLAVVDFHDFHQSILHYQLIWVPLIRLKFNMSFCVCTFVERLGLSDVECGAPFVSGLISFEKVVQKGAARTAMLDVHVAHIDAVTVQFHSQATSEILVLLPSTSKDSSVAL